MDIPFFYHEPSFDIPEEQTAILRACYPNIHCDDPNWTAPTEQEERGLFRQFNCVKYLSYIDDSEEMKIKGWGLRDLIFNNNMRSLRKVLSNWENKPLIDHDEIKSDSYLWLWDTIESFNYLLNSSRFTNYMHVSLTRNLVRYYQRKMKKLEMFQNVSETIWNDVEDNRRLVDCAAVETGLQKLVSIINTVEDESAKTILRMRLGLHDGKIWNFEAIGDHLGSSWQNISKRFDVWMIKLFGRKLPNSILKDCKHKD